MIPLEERRPEKAIAFSDFTEMERQEEQQSFRERRCSIGRISRKGEAGGWKSALAVDQVCH